MPPAALLLTAAGQGAESAPGMCSPSVVHRGSLRGQEVDHLNFRVIPMPSASEGLVIGWPQQPVEMEQLKNVQDEISGQL